VPANSRLGLPKPAAGEVTVKLRWAGVNFIDVYMRNGAYGQSRTYPSQLPMTLGMEGAGTVQALGEGVTDLTVGQSVAYCLARGTYAQYARVPAWRVVPVPTEIPLDIAAALMLQGCTAHYLTHSTFVLKSGDSCLVHAGAGGVGQLLIQIAKQCGVIVFATTSNPEKVEIVRRRGADHCILYQETDFSEFAGERTGGRGVDVVYDSVGQTTLERSLRCVRRRGLCVLFGVSSGPIASINPFELAERGSLFFTRPYLADHLLSAEEVRWRADDLFSMVQSGRLEVMIEDKLPLELAAEAHHRLESRQSRGKLLLEVDG
jgi:NADPH:quinone reductase